MKVFIELHDYNSQLHNEFEYVFTGEGEVSELRDQIKRVFTIDNVFQQLFFNGATVRSDTLSECGVVDKSTCVVKHSMIENWRAFVANFQLANQALESKRNNQIQESVDQSLNHLIPLMKSNFLTTYPRFDVIYREFKEKFARYMDQEYKYIEMAVQEYFAKVLADSAECPTLEIICQKKGPEEDGIQGGLICHISRNDILIGKYYIKEHMGLANWQKADIREIFAYKFLEMIGIGPTVHFIPNVHYSSFGLYIGTKEVPGFRRADTEEIELSSEIHAQKDLLRRVLLVKDLHSKNFGIDCHGNLSIVDLQIKNHAGPEMVFKYLDGYKIWKGSRDLRIRVAKESIKSWNILENFNRANTAISMQKELFRKYSIRYKPSHSFEDYFQQINNNLNALMERLEKL